MSVSIRLILLVCVTIFGLNAYFYSQQSGSKSLTDRQAVEEIHHGDSVGDQDDQKVEAGFISVD